MAIVVEEESPKVSAVSVLIWLIILAIVAVAVYYIFFAKPELVEIVAPPAFRNVDTLARVVINPNDVVGSQAFQALKQYITIPAIGNAGRANPFSPP